MGEVYLARDQSLERNVALKVLPPDLVRDEDRVRRFVLEAKSASSLSHPNIVTIYEIGQDVVRDKSGGVEPDSGPVQYMAMELIQGKTLSALIHEDKTDLRTLVGYLAQAAEGLAKAHSAGIVHRDLKPGNVMVSADGFAKVLDFGLAKLTEKREADVLMTNAPTAAAVTGQGTLLGTTAYMSPEQIRGVAVDARSDVFSFGSVLYEAATRARPFVAETAVETMHKILNEKPPPVEERNPGVPAELRRVIRRCLAKSPEQRVQSMKDLAIELREVVDEWDTLTTASISGSTISEAPKVSRPNYVLIGAGLVAVVAVVLAVWALGKKPAAPAPAPFQTMKMATLTTRGDVREASISPDGRYLAYLTGEAGHSSVRVRQIATGADLEVVPAEDGIFEGLSFTPDGNYLFYRKRRRDAPSYSALMQVASMGGASREVAFDVDSRATFSPDGRSIAFGRGVPQERHTNLVVRDLAAGKERDLVRFDDPRTISAAPAWSPDGRTIAVGVADAKGGGAVARLIGVDPESGAQRDLEKVDGGHVESIAWLPDGKALVRTGYDFGLAVSRQIALVPLDGSSRRVTNDVNDYAVVSVSKEDEAIAAVRVNRFANVWIADPAGGEPTTLTSFANPESAPFSVRACPDGTTVFCAALDGALRVWSIPAGGGEPRPLTEPGALAVDPFCIPGGIGYLRYDDKGFVHIWRVDADGANPRPVMKPTASQDVSVSADGSLIAYRDTNDDSSWLVPSAGGEPRKVVERPRRGAMLSPDGTKVLTGENVVGANGLVGNSVIIQPLAAGAPAVTLELTEQRAAMQWSPDGRAIDHIDRGDPAWNVYRAAIEGGKPQPLTRFTDGRVTGFRVSRDGKQIAAVLRSGGADNVWVLPVGGGTAKQITRFPKGDVFALEWRENGRLVVNAGRFSSDAVLIRSFR